MAVIMSVSLKVSPVVDLLVRLDMPARLHALMQDPHYLHQARANLTIVQNVHGRLPADTRIPKMEAANSVPELNSITSGGPSGSAATLRIPAASSAA
jgi:hypothetical protein